MARTLAVNSLTGKLRFAIAVDDDNSIGVWGTNAAALKAAMSVDGGVVVGSELYNGVTTPYVRCSQVDALTPKCLRWSATTPIVNFLVGRTAAIAIVARLASTTFTAGTYPQFCGDNNASLYGVDPASVKPMIRTAAYYTTLATTALGTTPFAHCVIQTADTAAEFWRADPGGARAVDGTGTIAVSSSTPWTISAIGGAPGVGAFADLRIYALLAFETAPAQSEFEALASGPYAALFGTSVPDPIITPASGTYPESQAVTTDMVSGTTVRYTSAVAPAVPADPTASDPIFSSTTIGALITTAGETRNFKFRRFQP